MKSDLNSPESRVKAKGRRRERGGAPPAHRYTLRMVDSLILVKPSGSVLAGPSFLFVSGFWIVRLLATGFMYDLNF
jgi:hypothetical protein